MVLTNDEKLALLRLINENKEELFGSWSSKLSKEKKTKCWQKFINVCVSEYGFSPVDEGKGVKYLRDTVWHNIKRATMKKVTQNSQTGSEAVSYSQIDSLVLEIVGEESATIQGIPNQFEADPANPHIRPPQRSITLISTRKFAQVDKSVIVEKPGDESESIDSSDSVHASPTSATTPITRPATPLLARDASTFGESNRSSIFIEHPSTSKQGDKAKKRGVQTGKNKPDIITLTELDQMKKRKLQLDIEHREEQIKNLKLQNEKLRLEIRELKEKLGEFAE